MYVYYEYQLIQDYYGPRQNYITIIYKLEKLIMYIKRCIYGKHIYNKIYTQKQSRILCIKHTEHIHVHK